MPHPRSVGFIRKEFLPFPEGYLIATSSSTRRVRKADEAERKPFSASRSAQFNACRVCVFVPLQKRHKIPVVSDYFRLSALEAKKLDTFLNPDFSRIVRFPPAGAHCAPAVSQNSARRRKFSGIFLILETRRTYLLSGCKGNAGIFGVHIWASNPALLWSAKSPSVIVSTAESPRSDTPTPAVLHTLITHSLLFLLFRPMSGSPS